MSRSYGVKKDFGLHKEGGVFLPEIYESEVASPSKSTSSYSSTMPAYNLHEHKGRGQYGMLSISSIDKSAGVRSSSPGRRRNASSSPRVGKSDSPRKETGKNSRGWFHGGRKNAKTSQKDGISDSVIEGVVQGNNMIRSSPMLHVRSAMRSGENDQFGRPQADPDELSDEEERMQLSYDAPVDVTRAATELIRLTLRPSKAAKSSDTLQVTLRKRGQGFGIHLSSGLPPITVTYVEPGGDAEAAGVSVGDEVVEVNGEECGTLRDATKIVALKLMIQQTDIREVSQDIDSENDEEEGNGLNDTTWSKIQARQHQDEVESQASSNVELTQIDGTSDTETQTALEIFREKAGKHSQQEQVEISETAWERMREQRELLFDKNAPSAIIQEKGRKRGTEGNMQTSHDTKSPQSAPEVSGKQQSGDGVDPTLAVGVSSTGKQTPEKAKSSGSWFKGKRKPKSPSTSKELNVSTTSTDTGAAGEVVAKKKSVAKKESFGSNKARNKEQIRPKQSASLQKSQASGVSGRMRGDQRGGLVMKVTSIDDVKEEEDGITKEAKSADVAVHVKKTFSYERQLMVQDSGGHVSTSLPRSKSHNAVFNASLLHTVQQHDHPGSLEAPYIGHHPSKSYQGEEKEEGGAGGSDGGWAGMKLNVEARNTSRSQSDVSRLKPEARVEFDSNLRVKKSGVVKGASSRGTGQRPTLEVFGTAERKDKGKDDKKIEEADSTDGPGTAGLNNITSSTPDVKIDLGAIPHSNPSLGRRPGHARRDLVARSSVKRRPPSMRGALLFQVDDSQRMGTTRVELSPAHRARTHTMPEKVSRKLIEETPLSSLTMPAYRTKNHKTRNIFKEHQKDSMNSELQPNQKMECTNSFNLQRQSSNTSTSSTAEMVTQAVAVKKQRLSSMAEEERKASSGVPGESEGELSSLGGGTAGSTILAKLRQQKQAGKEREEGGKGEEEEERKVEGGRDRPAFASRSQRRNKTVEKPVKSLGIASDPETTPSPGHVPQLPMVNLRETAATSRPRSVAISSSSTAPSWVAVAERKRRSISALLEKDPSTKPEKQFPHQEEPSKSFSLSPGPITTSKSPPITSPTPPPVTTSTSSSITTPTSPSVTTSTSSSITTPTFPSVTTATSPSVTTATSPSLTTPTSLSVTTATSPSVTTATSPSVTTTSTSTSETKAASFASDESGIPRKGHVRDRMALFQ